MVLVLELVPRSATYKYELKRLTRLADPAHRVEERDVISWEGWMWRDFGPESNSAEILALRWTADSLEHLVELAEKLQALRQKLGESGVEGSNIDMDSVRRNVEVAFEAARASERRYEDSHPLELPPLVNQLAYDIVVPYGSDPEFRIWVARYTKAEPTTADQHVQHTVLQLTVMPPDVTIIDNPHDSPVVCSMNPSDVVMKREESAEPSPTDNRQLSAELGSPSLSRQQPQGRGSVSEYQPADLLQDHHSHNNNDDYGGSSPLVQPNGSTTFSADQDALLARLLRDYPPAKGQEPVQPSFYPSMAAHTSAYTTIDIDAMRRLSLNDATMLDVNRSQNPSPTKTDTSMLSIATPVRSSDQEAAALPDFSNGLPSSDQETGALSGLSNGLPSSDQETGGLPGLSHGLPSTDHEAGSLPGIFNGLPDDNDYYEYKLKQVAKGESVPYSKGCVDRMGSTNGDFSAEAILSSMDESDPLSRAAYTSLLTLISRSNNIDSLRTFADYGLKKLHGDRAADTSIDYEYQRDTFVVARVCEQSRGMTLNLGTLIAICGLVDPENGAAVAARTVATLQLWSADNQTRTVNGWKSWRIQTAVNANELTARIAPSKAADQKALLAFLRSQHGDLLTAEDNFNSAWEKLVFRVNGNSKPVRHYTNGKKKGEADTLLDRAYYDKHVVPVVKKFFNPNADIESLWKGVLADKPATVGKPKSSADGVKPPPSTPKTPAQPPSPTAPASNTRSKATVHTRKNTLRRSFGPTTSDTDPSSANDSSGTSSQPMPPPSTDPQADSQAPVTPVDALAAMQSDESTTSDQDSPRTTRLVAPPGGKIKKRAARRGGHGLRPAMVQDDHVEQTMTDSHTVNETDPADTMDPDAPADTPGGM